MHRCAEWFRRELRLLQPDIVLLGISGEWPCLAAALQLPIDGSSTLPSRVPDAVISKLQLGYHPSGIWITNHFSAWNSRAAGLRHGDLILQIRQRLASTK